MLNRNKYWKATLGIFADVLISKNVDYSGAGASAVADFPSFVANAVEGELAFFNADTNALLAGTAGAASTAKIFGAVKRDTYVEKTPVFTLATFNAKRIVYSAGVDQISKVTFANAVIPGNYYYVKIMETTPGYQPFPSWEYGVTAKAGEAIATTLQRIVDMINDKTNAINKNTDSVATASLTGTVITITAAAIGITFRIALSYSALNDLAATAGYTGVGTANAFWGNGTFEQVAELEFESDVYKGLGTQYPNHSMARPSDFGAPSVFATLGAQYNVYIISGVVVEASPTPLESHKQPRTIVLAVAANGAANADAQVKMILGL